MKSVPFPRRGPLGLVMILASALASGGCSTLNGLAFGLEEDVDRLVESLDAAGDRFLPYGPPRPLEARRAERRSVRLAPAAGSAGRSARRIHRDAAPTGPRQPAPAATPGPPTPAVPRRTGPEVPRAASPAVAAEGAAPAPRVIGVPRHHRLDPDPRVVSDARLPGNRSPVR